VSFGLLGNVLSWQGNLSHCEANGGLKARARLAGSFLSTQECAAKA
jgi:hypothetical protein